MDFGGNFCQRRREFQSESFVSCEARLEMSFFLRNKEWMGGAGVTAADAIPIRRWDFWWKSQKNRASPTTDETHLFSVVFMFR